MATNKMDEAFADKQRFDSLKSRLWSKIKIGGSDECWEWQSKEINRKGYGHISSGRTTRFKAHRVAYAMSFGVMSDDICVCHKCDNPKCCNPSHLFLGTNMENTQDCIKKGRKTNPPHIFGEKHHATKFTKEQSFLILKDQRSYSTIAKEYGVCSETIGRLKRGESWKQLQR